MTLEVSMKVLAQFGAQWHPAVIRQVLSDGKIEVLWTDGTVSHLPENHVFAAPPPPPAVASAAEAKHFDIGAQVLAYWDPDWLHATVLGARDGHVEVYWSGDESKSTLPAHHVLPAPEPPAPQPQQQQQQEHQLHPRPPPPLPQGGASEAPQPPPAARPQQQEQRQPQQEQQQQQQEQQQQQQKQPQKQRPPPPPLPQGQMLQVARPAVPLRQQQQQQPPPHQQQPLLPPPPPPLEPAMQAPASEDSSDCTWPADPDDLASVTAPSETSTAATGRRWAAPSGSSPAAAVPGRWPSLGDAGGKRAPPPASAAAAEQVGAVEAAPVPTPAPARPRRDAKAFATLEGVSMGASSHMDWDDFGKKWSLSRDLVAGLKALGHSEAQKTILDNFNPVAYTALRPHLKGVSHDVQLLNYMRPILQAYGLSLRLFLDWDAFGRKHGLSGDTVKELKALKSEEAQLTVYKNFDPVTYVKQHPDLKGTGHDAQLRAYMRPIMEQHGLPPRASTGAAAGACQAQQQQGRRPSLAAVRAAPTPPAATARPRTAATAPPRAALPSPAAVRAADQRRAPAPKAQPAMPAGNAFLLLAVHSEEEEE